jgi:hypothetical protein
MCLEDSGNLLLLILTFFGNCKHEGDCMAFLLAASAALAALNACRCAAHFAFCIAQRADPRAARLMPKRGNMNRVVTPSATRPAINPSGSPYSIGDPSAYPYVLIPPSSPIGSLCT